MLNIFSIIDTKE